MTAAGRLAAPRRPGGDNRLGQTGDLGPPTSEAAPQSQDTPRGPHPYTTDSGTFRPTPTQDVTRTLTATHTSAVAQVNTPPKKTEGTNIVPKIRGTGRLVRFSKDSKVEATSSCGAPRVEQSEPWSAAPPVVPPQKDSQEKNHKYETTAPAKPPRAFNYTGVGIALALPTPCSTSSTSGLPPRTGPPEPHNPVAGDSNTERAPLAEDEVRDAYCSVRVKAARPRSTSSPAIRESTI